VSADQPSRSAEGVAFLRHLAGADPVAARFLGPRYRAMALPGARRLVRRAVGRRFPGGLEYQLARTRFFDDELLAELERGARQVVILGAGYDTRAHRLADRLGDRRVFELDQPATQALKRRRAPAAPHVAYVPIDFNADRVDARLRDAGWSPSEPTVFLSEGVMFYLDAAAVDATLALVPPGSAIVFDYLVRGAMERPGDYHGGAEAHVFLREGGEPWTFGLEHDEVEPFLAERGLETVALLGPEQLQARYVRQGRVATFHGAARARRP
jgi:methyltransferase (TIGR00027 family)